MDGGRVEGGRKLQLMLYLLCCHLLIQERRAEESKKASEAWLQLIITREKLPGSLLPSASQMQLNVVSRRHALRSARAKTAACYTGAFIQYVEGTGPAIEAPSLGRVLPPGQGPCHGHQGAAQRVQTGPRPRIRPVAVRRQKYSHSVLWKKEQYW